MKALLTLMLLAGSALTFAQTITAVVVTPDIPIDCSMTAAPLVNFVSDLRTMREDSDEVEVRFTTSYGACVEGRVVNYKIDPRGARVYTQQNRSVWPWQKEGVHTTFSVLSETELAVTVVLDKRVLFKKFSESHLSYIFFPNFSNYRFPWTIDAYLEGDLQGSNFVKMIVH